MSHLFWLSEQQINTIKPFFLLSHGIARVDDRKVISGIIYVIKNGLRSVNVQVRVGRETVWKTKLLRSNNAVAESFFHTLKSELVYGDHFKNEEEAKAKIMWYIEMYYNRKRMHSSLNYLTPEQFENKAKVNT